jgi:CheY-like chemotaxis protein
MSATNEPARILVVDDEPSNRILLKAALDKHAYRVELANDGHEALEKLAGAAFDLVLLDLDMPGCNGEEVLQRLKTHPALCAMPVIIVSATEELEGVVRCIEAGATDYLPKPFDRVLLEARVRSALAAKRPAEALEVSSVLGEVPEPWLPAESLPLTRAQESSPHAHRADAYELDDFTVEDAPTTTTPRVSGNHDGRWDRFTLVPGVELHVRESNAIPSSPQQRKIWLASVLERLGAALAEL